MMNKKLMILPVLALGAGIAQAQNDPNHPNIVFVLADDMGFSGIHAYGGNLIPSPNIDFLADNGIVCDNFRSTPISSATRVCLMTGKYQQRAGLNHIYSEVDPMDGLDPAKYPSFAKILQQAGYHTGLIGKWHMGQDIKFNPLNHGWDVWHGYTMGNIDFQSHYNTIHEKDWWDGKTRKDEPGYVTTLINKYSCQFIKESVAKKQPFFLMVSENAQDMVREMDKGVGEIMQTLKEQGVLENTIIIYTSDNGGEAVAAQKYPGNNGYFRGAKGSAYEGGCRVPLIFYYPKEWGHRHTEEAMSVVDMMPTFLDMCGVYNPRKVDGVSIYPTLRNGKAMPKRKIFDALTGWMNVVDGDWKCVWTKDKQGQDKLELFNLYTDRNEEHDLSAMFPDKVAGYKQDMLNWWADCTKGTRLEGRTTWNSGWVVELKDKLAKEGKTLMDLTFFQQAMGKALMNPVKKSGKKRK